MKKDERDLLDVLKFELKYLQTGGYRQSLRQPWRWRYIFEDSPTCFNIQHKQHADSCADCVLIDLVPAEFRCEQAPCQYIPMNSQGETLDSLYELGDACEVEGKVGKWLQTTIERLEEERKYKAQRELRPILGNAMKGISLDQKNYPKCANPACTATFQWLSGGKFFRFTPDPARPAPARPFTEQKGDGPKVKHFWLCECCCHIFTLVYDEPYGVLLTLLVPELPLPAGYEVDTRQQ